MNANTAEQMNIIHLAENPGKLLQAWQLLQTQHAGPMPLRARDAAQQLGVTEAQLVASRCGEDVTRLTADWPEMIKGLPKLGRIMSLVRNEHIVHERKGEYGHISFEGHGGKIGVVANEAIDLRIFLYRWSVAFAIKDLLKDGGERLSLQFFDKYGMAIQKIFLLEDSNKQAYSDFVEKYKDQNQACYQPVEILPQPEPTVPDTEIDLEGLRQTWAELKDTHDFYPMLKKFNVSRLQALRLGGEQWAVPVKRDSAKYILETASQTQLPIMVFVGNDNILQIHTGKIDRVKPIHGWLNVLDENFNLHLKEEAIETAWVVRKPTVDGIVTALELYDKQEKLIVTFFGKRKPGIPEDLKWRELAESLVK
jgi:putative hemin transport protein